MSAPTDPAACIRRTRGDVTSPSAVLATGRHQSSSVALLNSVDLGTGVIVQCCQRSFCFAVEHVLQIILSVRRPRGLPRRLSLAMPFDCGAVRTCGQIVQRSQRPLPPSDLELAETRATRRRCPFPTCGFAAPPTRCSLLLECRFPHRKDAR